MSNRKKSDRFHRLERRTPTGDSLVYIRLFDQKEWQRKYLKTFPISAYLPKPLLDTYIGLRKIGTIKDNDFIIGPLYTTGEIQIGVTGSPKYSESFELGMSRELAEEIGLIPNTSQELHRCSFGLKKWHKKLFMPFGVYVKDLEPVPRKKDGIEIPGADDKSRKVGCIVYGSLRDILFAYRNENIYRYLDHDRIIGVVAVSVLDINDYISL